MLKCIVLVEHHHGSQGLKYCETFFFFFCTSRIDKSDRPRKSLADLRVILQTTTWKCSEVTLQASL